MIDIEKFICSLIHRSSGFCVIKVVDIIDALHHQGLDYKDGKIIRITPEFKQSEDESIRKIISDILLIDSDEIREILDANNVLMQDVYAWLEKQDTNISSFPKEQQVFMKKYVSLDKITLIKLLAERDANNAETIKSFEKQGEQKPVNIDYISGIRKELLNIENNAENIVGLTESQWVAIRAAHRLLGEYITKEQNPSWSEEDRDYYDAIIAKLELTRYDALLTDNQMAFLKSFKDRYFWKPTDAQIASLTIACDRNDRIGFDLTQLLKDLKKLKE